MAKVPTLTQTLPPSCAPRNGVQQRPHFDPTSQPRPVGRERVSPRASPPYEPVRAGTWAASPSSLE